MGLRQMENKTANFKLSEFIENSIKESAQVVLDLRKQTPLLVTLAELLVQTYRNGGKMVLFGNGGSAADAQHLAAELLGGFTDHQRKSLPALSLTTDTSALTSIGNDYGYEFVFSRQVESMVNRGDAVVAISTSGNSKNVILGAKAAKQKGAVVIGFTGEHGGLLKKECDYCLCVPSSVTHYIQQAHTTAGHILCALIEQAVAEKR